MYRIRTKENKICLLDGQNPIGYFDSVDSALDHLRDKLYETLLINTVYVDVDERIEILILKNGD